MTISRRLKEGLDALTAVRPVLLDCSPALGVLSLNALLAADRVLMAVAADFLSFEARTSLPPRSMCSRQEWASATTHVGAHRGE